MAWCEGKVLSGICWQPVLSPNGGRLCFYHRKVADGLIEPYAFDARPPGWHPAARPDLAPSDDGWHPAAPDAFDQLLARELWKDWMPL